MNQQACLYVATRAALQDLCATEKDLVLDFSNKFRAFVLIGADHFAGEPSFHPTAVLPLNEILTQFLTHPEGTESSIESPIIVKSVTLHWVTDIDAFVGFSEAAKAEMQMTASCVSFYDDLRFLEKMR